MEQAEGLLGKIAYPGTFELDGEREGAWIEVIRKMDEVYSDLLRYETDLEKKECRAGRSTGIYLKRYRIGLRCFDRVRFARRD